MEFQPQGKWELILITEFPDDKRSQLDILYEVAPFKEEVKVRHLNGEMKNVLLVYSKCFLLLRVTNQGREPREVSLPSYPLSNECQPTWSNGFYSMWKKYSSCAETNYITKE